MFSYFYSQPQNTPDVKYDDLEKDIIPIENNIDAETQTDDLYLVKTLRKISLYAIINYCKQKVKLTYKNGMITVKSTEPFNCEVADEITFNNTNKDTQQTKFKFYADIEPNLKVYSKTGHLEVLLPKEFKCEILEIACEDDAIIDFNNLTCDSCITKASQTSTILNLIISNNASFQVSNSAVIRAVINKSKHLKKPNYSNYPNQCLTPILD
jgi:hypothetical protein